MSKPRRQRTQNTQPKAVPSSTRSRSSWLAGIGLVALALVSYGVWEFTTLPSSELNPDPAGVGQNAAPTDTNAASQSAESKETTRVSVRAPGSEQESFIAPLADAYRRIDPTADGWQTEAFHEATNTQLHHLADLFKDEIDDTLLEQLVDQDFKGSGFQPENLDEVFSDATIEVKRGIAGDQDSADIRHHGPDGLKAAIESFRQLYTDGKIARVKLKPFRILLEDDVVSTTLYFQSVGSSESGTLQVNARWTLEWSLNENDLPKLRETELDFYETVCHRNGPELMFSDCTASVLGNVAAYQQQFLRSTDEWRSKVSRDLGLDVVANHGLALGDVNGDDLEDIYLCQQGGLPNRLLLQNSDGTLRDASVESGTDWLDYCASALLVDFDNDGDRDLAVAQEWRILLMSNDGTGRFQLEFGISSKAQSFSLTSADYDLDGDLDIYVCGYNPTTSSQRSGAMGEPMPYHDANNGGRNLLLRNDGNWLFRDATADVGLDENNTRFSFAAAWEDYDNDGDSDLYVANDYGRNNLYRNDKGQFTDVAADLDVEDMSAGMSANWADVNRDGRMDLYISNMFSAAGNRITYQRQFKTSENEELREQFQRHARGNTLFLNTEDGFQDVSEQAGVTMGRWAWGSRFADLNGDGWEDLIVANGFISTADSGDL